MQTFHTLTHTRRVMNDGKRTQKVKKDFSYPCPAIVVLSRFKRAGVRGDDGAEGDYSVTRQRRESGSIASISLSLSLSLSLISLAFDF